MNKASEPASNGLNAALQEFVIGELDGVISKWFDNNLPICSVALWAKMMDEEEHTVRYQIREGYLPAIRLGKKLFINLEALRILCRSRDPWNS